MGATNIRFRTDRLAAYFEGHRDKWPDFYPSERWIIERACEPGRGLGRVLDVGCARGGLGLALSERKLLTSYKGIDINKPAIDAALTLPVPAEFECGDILRSRVPEDAFDSVFSLSCADWNVETGRILDACWSHVASGGKFIVSLRLTEREGINDIRRSYQPIVAGGRVERGAETANYVVFNVNEALDLLAGFSPARLLGYGYWGKPSKTAVTPYKKLVFAVFALWKRESSEEEEQAAELHLPTSLWMRSARHP